MVGKSKKGTKSAVAKKASAVEKAAGARGSKKDSKPSPANSKRAIVRSAVESALCAVAARLGSRGAAKTGRNKKSSSTISVKKVVCDGHESDETVSSLAESSSEGSDFEDSVKTKPKSKASKQASLKTDDAVKAVPTKTRAKGTKTQAKTKPRATKRGRKNLLENYAVPSPKKTRAAASAAASNNEDDDDCNRSEAREPTLFPDSPKTDDWRLAAAIDY
jgi:hypothetical protein